MDECVDRERERERQKERERERETKRERERETKREREKIHRLAQILSYTEAKKGSTKR